MGEREEPVKGVRPLRFEMQKAAGRWKGITQIGSNPC